MNNSYKLIEEGRKDELWKKHCGFLGLSREEFKEIQERLMREQLQLLGGSKLSQAIWKGIIPSSIEEFRRITPLTTYADYEKFLKDKNEEVLPVKPFTWARTSARSSQDPKWIPYTQTMYNHLSDPVIGAMLMSSCSEPGDVRLERNDKFLMATAPPPYASGYISRSTKDNLEVIFLPKLEDGEKMSYGERVATGFKLAMREGLDYFMGISVVLARMGEQFEQQSQNSKPSKALLNPVVLWRMLKALFISKINKRGILPKDIWHLKGIMSGGTDTEIYRDRIEHYWGRKPLEGFACTEAGNMAMQAWNYKGMIFFPDNAFLEFIPMVEVEKNKADPAYTPSTVLYNELDLGVYELVFSSFHGGVLMRYRIGDLFEVIANEDAEIGSGLPQMKFFSRADDLIDIGSFFRLTERDIWKTIEASGVAYVDWIARKEIQAGNPVLHLYIEPKPANTQTAEEIHAALDRAFVSRFADYQSLKDMLSINPLLVTLIPVGSFTAYMQAKIKAGADLAHLKPPHMKPSDAVLKLLLSADQ
ncbi:MAG: GH3 auxin-responsive promoter family protein [Chloroflexi bacterium]|nr:GH3 auxin-responsive promoter family protein [Chloroflexota bacterium]